MFTTHNTTNEEQKHNTITLKIAALPKRDTPQLNSRITKKAQGVAKANTTKKVKKWMKKYNAYQQKQEALEKLQEDIVDDLVAQQAAIDAHCNRRLANNWKDRKQIDTQKQLDKIERENIASGSRVIFRGSMAEYQEWPKHNRKNPPQKTNPQITEKHNPERKKYEFKPCLPHIVKKRCERIREILQIAKNRGFEFDVRLEDELIFAADRAMSISGYVNRLIDSILDKENRITIEKIKTRKDKNTLVIKKGGEVVFTKEYNTSTIRAHNNPNEIINQSALSKHIENKIFQIVGIKIDRNKTHQQFEVSDYEVIIT